MKLSVCVLVALFVMLVRDVSCSDDEKPSWMDKWKGKMDKLKKKLKENQEEVLKKFKAMMSATEKDNPVGENTLRINKKGGAVMIQRKGQFLAMKLVEFVERDENGTEVGSDADLDGQQNYRRRRAKIMLQYGMLQP